MEKEQKYDEVTKEILSVVNGEPSATARYASAACLLSQTFDYFFWTGFYIVDSNKPRELVVGPYQGTLGCLRIAFGRGVCGAAAESLETQLVPDVHAFPGHIACDSRTNSEIVVPVFNDKGELAAVLDVDSTEYNSFDDVDKNALERLCGNLLNGASQT